MTAESIVVGVDRSRASYEAVWWAISESRKRAGEFVLVHAPDGADAELAAASPTMASIDDAAAAVLNAHREQTERLAPEIRTRTRVLIGAPAAALIEASRHACLLVLGYTGQAGFRASALGSVAHRVAVHAHCPVVLVPEGTARLQRRRIVAALPPLGAESPVAEFASEEASLWNASLAVLRARGTGVDERRAVGGQVARAGARVALAHRRVETGLISCPDEAVQALVRESRSADLLVLGCQHTDDPFNCRLGPIATAVLARAACPVALVGQRAIR